MSLNLYYIIMCNIICMYREKLLRASVFVVTHMCRGCALSRKKEIYCIKGQTVICVTCLMKCNNFCPILHTK